MFRVCGCWLSQLWLDDLASAPTTQELVCYSSAAHAPWLITRKKLGLNPGIEIRPVYPLENVALGIRTAWACDRLAGFVP